MAIAYIEHTYGGAYQAYRAAEKYGTLMLNMGNLHIE